MNALKRLLLIILTTVFVAWLISMVLANNIVTITGTSMWPTISDGAALFCFPQASYAVGDVVVYINPYSLSGEPDVICHRIVNEASAGYVMRGDNNDYDDLGVHPVSNIKCKVFI